MSLTSRFITSWYTTRGSWTDRRTLRQRGSLSQTNSARTRWPRPNWSNAVRTDSSPEQSDPTLITGPVALHGQELRLK